ncbi:hypothetical protein AIOL_001395 [Candidatus Rhodobacter oscarellae]|uniref:Co-chaperone DjlA N-terminal domain-containing protein n=1 Tax=Candidatus Rhodobacter oscarellae TaxID=1675527 RepID=A0A0J9E0H0_9RHOB|nr:hypothetical protein [Candidatus Rhodobacter lobularis]KMW56441.1 hypothetical protein AIOL_001395 [Candidatus Rhodobacter lobularis]
MPFLIALLGIAGAVIFWMYRARDAANAASDLADMAGDVVSAARRFGFRRRYNTHPVDSIEDADLAVGGLGVAFLQLGGTPTAEQRAALLISLQSQLGLDREKAEELDVLGQWFVNECNGPAPAVSRLSKRLFKLSGAEQFETVIGVAGDVGAANGGELSDQQRDALGDIKNAFRIR